MNFIQLTEAESPSSPSRLVKININHIMVIRRYKNGSRITTTAGTLIMVNEKPHEIMEKLK